MLMNNTITLLNGKQYSPEDLIPKMDDDKFYYGELGRTALSSSL